MLVSGILFMCPNQLSLWAWVHTDKLFIRCLRDGPSRLGSVNSPDWFDRSPIRIWTGKNLPSWLSYFVNCLSSSTQILR